ncbi:MAG TPA: hypothetical protein VN705_04665 [Steroidobacteraceae bacterium]|nr:hypothetical protein [Steroidobacteraceae bacterium]
MYTHARTPRRIHRFGVLLCMLSTALACKVHAQAQQPAAPAAGPAQCLPAGNGYLRARLSGAMSTELNWGNDGTECTGAVRPTDGGIRMRFSRPDGPGKLVLVFGIAQLAEGKSARNVPVNVTLIREGAGQFFSTQGDDKCTLDLVTQDAIVGIPHRARSYRVTARGFCTEPARAVRGKGSVLLSRFDYSGRVDFGSEDKQTDDDVLTAGKQ